MPMRRAEVFRLLAGTRAQQRALLVELRMTPRVRPPDDDDQDLDYLGLD